MNIIALRPFEILGRMDARLDFLLVLALRLGNDDLLNQVEVLKRLRNELWTTLIQAQRETTVRQLEESIAIQRTQQAGGQGGLDFLE